MYRNSELVQKQLPGFRRGQSHFPCGKIGTVPKLFTYEFSVGRCGGSVFILVSLLVAGPACQATLAGSDGDRAGPLRIGWASADLTPGKPVVLTGFSQARVSEGVADPITATVLAIESGGDGVPAGAVIMVSCDLISISDELRDRVRAKVKRSLPEIDSSKVVLNATHTHCGPETRTKPDLAEKLDKFGLEVPLAWSRWGIDLGAMSPLDYVEFASDQIAKAVERAWTSRKPGGVSFGLAYAVVGHNRLTAYTDGHSRMYGSVDQPNFSHIEGYEDHSVNLLYTWNAYRKLTGVLINVAVPSQASGGSRISADFWHETRNELRNRLGEELFVLPQCSAAGDQSPVVLIGRKAEDRMERLTGRSRREQIAVRIADAVISILPGMEKTVDWNPAFSHRMERVKLSRRRLSEQDIKTPRKTHHRPQLESVEEAFDRLRQEYQAILRRIQEQPELKQKRGWYQEITGVYWRMARASRVLDRFELQKTQPAVPVEVHVIRLGDMAIATNPFELYLDFGSRMKARSKAVQTFVVQLAGSGSYVPTERSVAGGAYGAIPESTEVGPEGGRELVERTLELLDSFWGEKEK